jgi:para-nitrobenzyl esterase
MARFPSLAHRAALVALGVSLAAGCGGSDDNPAPGIVTLADGKVQGDVVGGSRRFLKIPFAKPPVGDLRWKAPVKNDPWTGVRHETEFSQPCAQHQSLQVPQEVMNEDCLYLNVWTPEPAPEKAPVMVWFHGGGNSMGSAADELPLLSGEKPLWYDGQFFAARQHVVVVTTNYRLGVLGFFAHPDLPAEGSPLGDQGLLDQRLALTWVRDNIAQFGGDPDNVTIFGESAGSADVCYQVVSPGSRGLFHRAISESGGCAVSLTGGLDSTAAQAAVDVGKYVAAIGCDTAPDELACLRSKTIDEVMAAAPAQDPMAGILTPPEFWFGVVVDGVGGFLPDQPGTLFDQGDIAQVPYLLGSNTDEGNLFFAGTTQPSHVSDYEDALSQLFGANCVGPIEALYPASEATPLPPGATDPKRALARVIGDSRLVCPTHETARRAVRAGLNVFMYNFNMPWAPFSAFGLGATHASEISHVFGNPFSPSPDDIAVSDAMNSYWAQFARSGDPSFSGASAIWPHFVPTAAGDDERLQLDAGWEILESFRKSECAFWRQYAEDPSGACPP